jgi:hypothetical protein
MPSTRTTIRIDEELYRRAKALSARTGRTVSEVIEDAVRHALAPKIDAETALPELPTFGGSGTRPGVDLTDSSALRDLMDSERLDAMR